LVSYLIKTVTISIKDAEKAHSENKNKEVAKPALESQWNTHRFLKLADVHPDEFFEMEPFPVSYFQELNLLGSNDSASFLDFSIKFVWPLAMLLIFAHLVSMCLLNFFIFNL
jgi:hypothetical protein